VDILLTLLNVVSGVILTGIGIEMVNNPPGDIRWKKNLYRLLFAVFGCAIIATTFLQSVRTAKEQERLHSEAQQGQIESTGKLNYMQGTLDTIAKFESQFIASHSQSPDESTKAAVAAAAQILKAATPSLSPTKSVYEAMNNIQLQNFVLDFAKELRDFEATYRNSRNAISSKEQSNVLAATTQVERDRSFNNMMAENMQLRSREDLEFRQHYFGEAIAVRDVLLQRVPNAPKPKESLIALDSGSLTGPEPISDVADYLELLARKIPVKR